MRINTLPNNEDAEKSLVGLTLVKRQIPIGARVLATTDFYNPFYRVAWSSFLALEADSLEIDPIAAIELIKLERPDVTVAQLMEASTGIPNTNEELFVTKIREASTRRYLIRKLDDAIKTLEKGGQGVISSLRKELNDLEYSEELKGSFIPLSQIIKDDVIPALYDLNAHKSGKISTGFPALDSMIGGGFSLSDLILVAGVPGGGKSAFVLQLARNIAKQNMPVAFLSGEMSNKENGLRLLSLVSGYQNLNSVTHISHNDLEFLKEWTETVKDLPIYFDTRTSDMKTLSVSLRSAVEQYGIKILVVDYVQLMKLNKYDKQDRYQRIAECSQELKRLAMEFQIAIIEVAQFNREGAKSDKPGMHDLEGSSQLEKDTSLIFILDREADTDNVTLRIVKGRNTGQSSLNGKFHGWKLNFEF